MFGVLNSRARDSTIIMRPIGRKIITLAKKKSIHNKRQKLVYRYLFLPTLSFGFYPRSIPTAASKIILERE